MELPSIEAMHGMIADLNRSLDDAAKTQQRIMRVTATATSPDRLVTAEVGPRGQLIALTIDPRVYRMPNAAQLAATIVATVREATEAAMEQVQGIVRASVPADLLALRPGVLPAERMMTHHDADLTDLTEEDDHGFQLRRDH